MRTFIATAFAILMSLFSVAGAFAQEWRRIVPLHSTREDVERLLGAPKKNSPNAAFYNFSDEIAVVHFQTISCKDACGFGWNVPVGTVTSIGVIPKVKYRKDKLFLKDDFKFEKTDGGFVYYTKDETGISVEEYNDNITLITYSPARKEDSRRCPRIPDCIVETFPMFDAYGNIRFSDEKARLDNYVIQINAFMGRGAIVVYGENPAVRNKLMRRAARAKNYLIQKRGLESQRVLIVSGGYKEHSITELHLYTIGDEVRRIWIFPEKEPR